MTTEPKFVPNEAVHISLSDNAAFRVRLIDCVGYIVPSAMGYIENEIPRMVRTPWFEEEIPFAQAAEIGTRKVILFRSKSITKSVIFCPPIFCSSTRTTLPTPWVG